ncbi:MAG: CHASE2 domain-containing protein [bacterium]
MSKKRIVYIVVLSIVSFLIISLFYLLNFFNRLDYMAYDSSARFIRHHKKISDRIAVILIDEASLETLNPIVGRWPWPRAIYSDLLDFLSMGKPKAILFDILFTENQKDNDTEGLGINDMQLVSATHRADNVYHAMQFLVEKEDEINERILNRPLPTDFIEKFSIKNIDAYPGYQHLYNNYYIPFRELYTASEKIGIVEFLSDSDGGFRRTRPIREYGGNFYPVMGIAPFVENNKINITKKSINVGEKKIPVNKKGHYILNIYGEYTPYSISGIFASLQKIREGDIENIMVDPMEFKDKIVFLGASAVGVEDLKFTPIAPRTPGVFLHATLASNFLLDDFLVPPSPEITLLSIVIFTILCVMGIIYSDKFWLKSILPLALLFLWVAFALFQLHNNVLYEIVPPVAAIIFSCMTSFGFLAITEGREKLRVKKMFSQYVSPEVVSEIMKDKDFTSNNTGRKVDLTVLFSDIRGFTSYSDRTPPEDVVEMLNIFFSNMTNVIFSTKGTIDKFIGDAIMAFWGAPLIIADHPDQAVITGINMIHESIVLNKKLKERGFDLDLKIGVGINSGDAILGNIGSQNKLNYTIVGDTVNLASRLEGLTKTYGCPVIISEYTYERLKQHIACRVIDEVKVRGKCKTTKIYEPLSCKERDNSDGAQELCEVTNQAFECYQNKEYRRALDLYCSIEDGILKDTFISRCKEKLQS